MEKMEEKNMGLGIAVGVATEIHIEKKGDFKTFSKEEILESVKDSLDLTLYNITEDEKHVNLDIKEEIFMDNIYDLLVKELEDFDIRDNEKQKLDNLLERIKDAKSMEEIEKITTEDYQYFFHFLNGCPWESISYISKDELCIFATLFTYSFSFKVVMECYFELFNYLRKKLQKSIDNPLKDDVFLMITTA